MSGKSELLTLTPLISARFYLRTGFFDPVTFQEATNVSGIRFPRFIFVTNMDRLDIHFC